MHTCGRINGSQALIEKSGTGIERFVAGVERSGTGAERVRTVRTSIWTRIGLALLFVLAPYIVFADDAQILCKPVNGSGVGTPCGDMSMTEGFEIEANIDGVVVSGIGSVADSGYALIALQQHESSGDFSLLVNGSGIGSASTGPFYANDLAWGFAEVAVDGKDVFVVVHRIEADGTLMEVATN